MANQEQMAGQFEQIKGKIKEKWGKLSDDDIALLKGKQEQFFGRLEEIYGIKKEDAERSLRELREMMMKSRSETV